MDKANTACDNSTATNLAVLGETLQPLEMVSRLVCRAVIRETPAMSSFVMERVGGPLRFRPGQHLTVHVDIEGKPHRRCYSISSSPLRTEQIHLTVKREAGGLVSNWLHDRLRVGSELLVSGPAGRFNIVDQPGERPLFLSAGSGITPIMSMLRWLADRRMLTDAILVHCSRQLEDIAFRDELEALQSGHCRLKVHFLLGRQDVQSWQGGHRRICGDLLRGLVADPAHRTAYLCGPEGFMSAARAALTELDVRSIHAESFGNGPERPKQDACADPIGGRVTFMGSGAAYDCTGGETVLDAAEACGIWLNSACRQGVCGSCRCRLVSGAVNMNALGGLTDEEKADGWILPCCSLPRGPVTVQL